MDPVLTLKRSCEVDAKACIFCQKRLKDEYLRTATGHCKTVVRDAMNMRNKFRDVQNRETITRLEEVMDNKDVSILWHVKCFSLFTSKDKIRRLENRINRGETCTKPSIKCALD